MRHCIFDPAGWTCINYLKMLIWEKWSGILLVSVCVCVCAMGHSLCVDGRPACSRRREQQQTEELTFSPLTVQSNMICTRLRANSRNNPSFYVWHFVEFRIINCNSFVVRLYYCLKVMFQCIDRVLGLACLSPLFQLDTSLDLGGWQNDSTFTATQCSIKPNWWNAIMHSEWRLTMATMDRMLPTIQLDAKTTEKKTRQLNEDRHIKWAFMTCVWVVRCAWLHDNNKTKK